LGVAVAPAATAKGQDAHAKKGWSRTLSTDVVLPFGMAVSNGKVYVADGAKNAVFRLDGSSLTFLAAGLPNTAPEGQDPNSDVAGIDVADDGSYAYTTARTDASGFTHIDAQLIIKKAGKPDVVADILAYERAKNPDQRNTYGLDAGTDCADGRAWLGEVTGGAARYTGIVDSHPYAVASLGHGSWAVADAGANAIFKVSATGQVSTIAVLPPQRTTITQGLLDSAVRDQQGNPVPAPPFAQCLVGKSYGFEPVPTDVEVGPLGQFWVSTLPGGPEDPSLGARGSVYLVNPATGWSFRLATGFTSATNLAVTREGTVYVAELFAGKITKVTLWGAKSTFQTVVSPLSLEVDGRYVYAATAAVFGPGGGQIIQYRR
jgi:hypothetical protein